MSLTSDQICELTQAIKKLTEELQKLNTPMYAVAPAYNPYVQPGYVPYYSGPNTLLPQTPKYTTTMTVGAPINTNSGNY